PIVVTGVGASFSERATREPVTCTSCSSEDGSGAGSGSGSAHATPEQSNAPAKPAMARALRGRFADPCAFVLADMTSPAVSILVFINLPRGLDHRKHVDGIGRRTTPLVWICAAPPV